MNFREVLRSIRVGSNVLRRTVPCCPRSVSAGLAGLHPVGRVQQLSPRHSREREEILRRLRGLLPLSSPAGVVAVHLLRDRRGLRERALGTGLPVLLPRQPVVSPAGRRDRLSHQHAAALRPLLALALRGPLRLRVLPPPRAAPRRARRAAQHPRARAQEHPAQRQPPAVQRNRHGHRGGVQQRRENRGADRVHADAEGGRSRCRHAEDQRVLLCVGRAVVLAAVYDREGRGRGAGVCEEH